MVVISARDVWKKYKIYYDRSPTLKERILFRNRTRYEERWVLKGIDIDIEEGQAVGLIGENGSGKSTLLKLFTRIIYPNKGSIEMKGKVASLLELGAGFHPDMTGRENIYTNASIFGLTKEEIDEKLDDIISFSELDKYIDNPVRTYSSGMYMRLAFSVAINVQADILLIDEILAVGDVNFQKKCFNKLKELKREGTTIVIVSHDLSSIEKICDRAVWLNEGKLMEQGDTKQVIDSYMQHMNRKQEERLRHEHERHGETGGLEPEAMNGDSSFQEEVEAEEDKVPTQDPDDEAYEDGNTSSRRRWGGREIEITSVRMLDKNKNVRHGFNYGDQAVIEMDYVVNEPVSEHVFGVGIFDQDGVHCYGTNTYIDAIEIDRLNKVGKVSFIIDRIPLIDGTYYVDVAAHAEDGRAYDYQRRAYEFAINSDIEDAGIVRLEHEWIIR